MKTVGAVINGMVRPLRRPIDRTPGAWLRAARRRETRTRGIEHRKERSD
ncbi:hypothetical protein HSB1_02920 [Halogranum salarium B-1]|uniref:Uncharacterized protein n=1 Tax=Halogranum salarium B-1 TaxID=1210908 RepID=J3JHT2_9EURY|nr:hypothetical protein HSB1_02920 [Halogranum salarium B-1]